MPYTLSQDDLSELLASLCGHYRFEVAGGRVRAIARDLPGTAVAVVCPPRNGVMMVMYDLRKPDAMGHLRDLIREWWTSTVEPVAFPDGTVEMMARILPQVDLRPRDVAIMATV